MNSGEEKHEIHMLVDPNLAIYCVILSKIRWLRQDTVLAKVGFTDSTQTDRVAELEREISEAVEDVRF